MFGKKYVTERWFEIKCKIIDDNIEHAKDFLRREFDYKLDCAIKNASKETNERITALFREIDCLKGRHHFVPLSQLCVFSNPEPGHILYCKHCHAPDKTVVRVTEKAGDE